MRTSSPIFLAVLILSGMAALPLQADYLKNTDFKEGLELWHGDGIAAFLTPDGVEGAEGDPGVIPVIKLPLSGGSSHTAYQDFETQDNITSLHVKVEVFASNDFKRSKFASDYTYGLTWKPGSIWYWSVDVVPNVDFWIRGMPNWYYKLTNLKPGEWTTVDGRFDMGQTANAGTVSFCVPPGAGTIYIKNPSAGK